MERASESGLPIDPACDENKLTDFRPDFRLGRPGRYPFTRGVYPRMFLDHPPAVRQYAGERHTGDVLCPLRDAHRDGATLGEVCDAPRDVWGAGRPERI